MENIKQIGEGNSKVNLVKINNKEYALKRTKINAKEIDILFRIKSPYILHGVDILSEGYLLPYLPIQFESEFKKRNLKLLDGLRKVFIFLIFIKKGK